MHPEPQTPAPLHPGEYTGLTGEEARCRLEQHGSNDIPRRRGPSLFKQIAERFRSLTLWLLIAACGVSLALGETVNTVAIAAIVVLNALVGLFQEHRAERSLNALRSMAAPKARVRRDGRDRIIDARDVVPGDLLVLKAGDRVAADARLNGVHALQVNEATLTGESVPSVKSLEPVSAQAALADRRDRVFAGTAVVNGTGLAVVEATGMRTELGKIASLLSEAREDPTPLQRRLEAVGRSLLVLCLGIVAVVAFLGIRRGLPWLEVALSSISLAVAAVPEGLPVVVTVALAIGVQRMARRKVLVRSLPAVETLGCATVICTDKTGTLTAGLMTVREIWSPDARGLLEAAAACCDAELDESGRGGIGDASELALLVAAGERGLFRADLERRWPRLEERPFEHQRRRMSILRANGVLYVKGAPESVLPLCSGTLDGVDKAAQEMAEKGLRVFAVAIGTDREEKNLRLLGLAGIADPPRPEAVEAVRLAREAGIRTVMITGDHPDTARAVAHEMRILTAQDHPAQVVHARIDPARKLHIVREWKNRGEIVAMTGDGVNDAPALREAHIGVAMGRGGTDVAREAADMILLDDNFASIVAAIHEGRGIFENIRKTLVYLLTGNVAELVVMLGASVAGLPLPLLPLQLLWINLVTDGLPALALVADPADPQLLQRPPRHPQEQILGRRQWQGIALVGILEAAVALAAFAWQMEHGSLEAARQTAFSVLVFMELLRAFAARSETKLFWEVGAFSNLRLLAVVAVSALLQLSIPAVPGLAHLLGVSGFPLAEGMAAVALGFVPVSVLELRKLLLRRARAVTRSPRNAS